MKLKIILINRIKDYSLKTGLMIKRSLLVKNPEYLFMLLFFLFIFIAIFSLELLLRKQSAYKINSDNDVCFCFDLNIGIWHKKNFSCRLSTYSVAINKHGLRDSEIPYRNIHNRYRILILGDSIAWGFGVNNGETFADFIEKELKSTDVINMGVAGYGTGEEFLLLKYEGLRYKPNTVILFFYIGNDVIETYMPESRKNYPTNIFYLEDGQLKIKYFQISFVKKIGFFLNEKSYILGALSKLLLKMKGPSHCNWVEKLNDDNLASVNVDFVKYANYAYLNTDKPYPAECFKDYESLLFPNAENYYKVELVKKIILEIKTMTEENNVKFIVVLSPFRGQLNQVSCYFDNPLNKELMSFFKASNIKAIDLLPLFVQHNYVADKIFLDSAHFSVFGHREVAKIIIENLKDQ